MEFIDTHAHLDFPDFDGDRDGVIDRAGKACVDYIVNVGADLASSQKALELSKSYKQVFAAVGVHPHDADKVDGKALDVLEELSRADRVMAIGEIGLDFYYDNSPRQKQKEVFIQQLNLARSVNLPVVIHSREAVAETLDIIEKIKVKEIGGIWHCFTGDLSVAKEAIDNNLYLGFGGLITFKKLDDLRQVLAKIPLERIVLETDCPFLTPHPQRGKRNEPLYVKMVARKVAEIKGISLEEVAEVTTENAKKVYDLPI